MREHWLIETLEGEVVWSAYDVTRVQAEAVYRSLKAKNYQLRNPHGGGRYFVRCYVQQPDGTWQEQTQ